MIDWTLAERIASMTSGDEPSVPRWIDAARLANLRDEAVERVVSYTALDPVVEVPELEGVDRREWVSSNLAAMKPLVEPMTADVASGLGPLGAPVRIAAATMVAAQAGALAGYLSQRVLGQYEMALLDVESPARLLFVTPNLGRAADELGAPADEVLRWVGFHEVTHAVQFGAAPWLRSHIAGLVSELIASVGVGVDLARVMRLPGRDDLRALSVALREGDLVSLAVGPERRELLDRLQAAMALVEGHAEHVMDAAGTDVLPSLPRLRGGLDRRRRTRPPLLALLERLIGLELKMRQYALGKRFCDEVVDATGVDALNAAFAGPDALPTLAELERPREWVARTAGAAAVAGA